MSTCVYVQPASAHYGTVVFLHGRGDDAKQFSKALNHSRDSRGNMLADTFPGLRWVFPQAPLRKLLPTSGWWHQWFFEYEELQEDGLKEVVPQIRQILADEAARLGGRWDRVILAGVGTGAATAAHVLFNLDIPGPEGRLGAFLSFTCRCPLADRSLAEMRQILGLQGVPSDNNVLRNTPVLLEHNSDNPVIRKEDGRILMETLEAFGAKVRSNRVPGYFNLVKLS